MSILIDRYIDKFMNALNGGIRGILTHFGRVTHILVSDLSIIGSNHGLSPDRHQGIIWTNAEYC